jgi:chorismate synthase
MGIQIGARIVSIGSVVDEETFDPLNPTLEAVSADFPVLSEAAGTAMQELIASAQKEGDSVGGIVECVVKGLPAGLGEPMFGGVESRIAQIVYGIPAVKSVEFGIGRTAASLFGSQCNDSFTVENGQIRTLTNHCGGILGGITNGMPVLFQVAFKPTPSIQKLQQTVNLSNHESTQLQIQGRHDPCIVPRAVPVVEAAAAIAIFDLVLGNTQTCRRK